MDDFPGLLARDYGFKPQGKSAPMAPPRSSSTSNHNSFASAQSFGLGDSSPDFSRSSSSTRNKFNSNPIFDDHGGDGNLFNDVFAAPPKYNSSDSRAPPSPSRFDYDSIFKDRTSSPVKSASMPVYDKPVYDDDIFEGLPGVKRSSTPQSASASASVKYEDVFSSISSSSPKHVKQDNSAFDDLLGNFGRKETESKKKERPRTEKDTTAFDDLIPGFGGGSSPVSNRSASESVRSQTQSSVPIHTTSNIMEDPFVVLESSSSPAVSSSGLFTDPLEQMSKFSSSGSTKADQSSVSGVFVDLDHLDNVGKSAPQINRKDQGGNHLRSEGRSRTQSPVDNSDGYSQKNVPIDKFQDSYQSQFDIPPISVNKTASPPYMHDSSPNETKSQVNSTPNSDENMESFGDVWLTVSEIPLFTQPTRAPPPSRPPPPRPSRTSKSEAGYFPDTNPRKNVSDFSSFPNSSQHYYNPNSARASARSPVLDEFEDFAMGRGPNNDNEYAETGEDIETNSVAAAAAMKEAMDRAEAKFRHAREVREKEYMKASRSRDGGQMVNDDYQEKELRGKQERLDQERQQREREEEDMGQARLEKERERARELEKEREEKERERRKERERLDRERELARQAVERATREARERAAIEARAKAERAAAAGARERAEKAAVQRAQAEARQRAAADAKQRAERAAAEARERSNSEAREKEARARAEQAAVERAAAEARERAAAAARANQQKNDNDLESFFSMGSRPSSAPRHRNNSSDHVFDTQSKGGSEAARTSAGASSSMRKASSATNIVDDLTSIFGGATASSASEFQEVEGETEDRRRARLERQQRTQERAAKALAEKNQRDLQVLREQAERHRISETLDVEIKRWAAGKEGNLRALLSTMQYVLWPECGWQAVSLTDLITAASVKKAYRKATLCIHPDKVQQKGANLQQKYVAEKVFDLLKEAWNKFNSEELF